MGLQPKALSPASAGQDRTGQRSSRPTAMSVSQSFTATVSRWSPPAAIGEAGPSAGMGPGGLP